MFLSVNLLLLCKFTKKITLEREKFAKKSLLKGKNVRNVVVGGGELQENHFVEGKNSEKVTFERDFCEMQPTVLA